MTIGALLTVLRLLAGTAAAMGARDILLLLGFGLHLAIIFRLITSTSEVDAVFQYILKIVHNYLMVEQSYTCEGHGDIVFVAGLDHIVITHAATCLGDELHTALMGTLDIVAEGEERV